MRYNVEISRNADQNIAAAYEWIAKDSVAAADQWVSDLLEEISTLADFPLRCPLAPENADHLEEIRQLLCGRYRILFIVRQNTVLVLHVRHASRSTAVCEEL